MSQRIGRREEEHIWIIRWKSGEKPRLSESSYSTSKNMPLKPPKKKQLARWPRKIHVPKGYYVAKSHEGINPATGFRYRRYTLIRLNRRA